MIPQGFERYEPEIPESLRPSLSAPEILALAMQAETSADPDVRQRGLARLAAGGIRPVKGWLPVALRPVRAVVALSGEVRLTTDLDAMTRAPDKAQRDLFEEVRRG